MVAADWRRLLVACRLRIYPDATTAPGRDSRHWRAPACHNRCISQSARQFLSPWFVVLEKCCSVNFIVNERSKLTGEVAEEAASCCSTCKTGNRCEQGNCDVGMILWWSSRDCAGREALWGLHDSNLDTQAWIRTDRTEALVAVRE